MKRMAAALAALVVIAVVATAEGAVRERRMGGPEPATPLVERLLVSDPRVHTQEPVQGARCTEDECTPQPIDVEVLGAPVLVALDN
jgi:hypothetical protein